MNIKKFFAGAVASAVSMSVLAVAANAYTAQLYYASGDWYAQTDTTKAVCEVDGSGTYTITAGWTMVADEETGSEMNPVSSGVTVLVVDIPQLGTDLGVSQDEDYDMSKCTFSDVKLVIGGNNIPVDNSKLLWGDPEDKGNLRLEIYNAYGSTCTDQKYDSAKSPINPDDVVAWEDNDAETSVTFTLTIAGESAEATEAPATEAPATEASTGNANTGAAADKNNADTGVEGVAAIAGAAIIAAGAIVVAKKRK